MTNTRNLESNFDGAKFIDVALDDTRMVRICAFKTTFSDCSMIGVDLSEADLQQVSKLKWFECTWLILDSVTFRNCELIQSDFSMRMLERANS